VGDAAAREEVLLAMRSLGMMAHARASDASE
jgi:hypothetical protein